MAMGFLSSLNPINSFPDHHGPYAVGTVDVEVPAADLPAPCPEPEDAQPTIAFRIFYPCVKPTSSETDRPVRWVAHPQRLTIAALLRFLGLTDRKASVLSYLPQHLYWIKLNAHRNAKLLDPPSSNSRWPVTFFSHGLAGSRNTYSYVCGDMASNGMVVIALDHRDGSSPIQFVRATSSTEAHTVDPIKISHTPSKEVYEARDKQLRIRSWEMAMAYEALMQVDAGQKLENLDTNTSRRRQERIGVLNQFERKLDLHRAGKVSWCGHSFGAATVTQLMKSLYYGSERPSDAGRPLIVPDSKAAILQQVTPESPTLLLDMWGLPMQSPDQAFLWDKPLPTYASGGLQGDNVLAVLSEGFHNWTGNLNINKHVIGAPSSPSEARRVTREQTKPIPAWAGLRDDSPSQDSGYGSQDSRSPGRSPSPPAGRASEQRSSPDSSPAKARRRESTNGPHMFFVQQSQHFSQSDFGILFPWLAKRLTKAEDPERILELNVRAIMEVIRGAGIEVAGDGDNAILETSGEIPRWVSVPVGDNDEAKSKGAPKKVDRKQSIASTGNAAPRDEIATGETMDI